MELTLIDKKYETLNTVSFFFKPSSPISWTPGQFLIYNLEHKNPDIRGKMRFFTISSAPFEDHIAITTIIDNKAPSSFKKALKEMPLGGKIQAKGPNGNFIIKEALRKYVFIAGGVGITPFRSIISDLTHDESPIDITLLYAYKNNDIVFKKEFDKITEINQNIKINYFISPMRINAKSICNTVSDPKKSFYYISGPNNFVKELSEVINKQGVEEKKIKHDYFSGYDNY